jgi:hypothetical protein
MQLLGQIVDTFLVVKETSKLFSKMAMSNPFSLLFLHHLKKLAILMGLYIVILICLYLVTTDVEHLFMYLFAICISFSEK